MALGLSLNKTTHRAGEQRESALIYPARMLIATHEEPLPIFTVQSAVGPFVWATTAGTLQLFGGGQVALLIPPNQTRVVTVSVTDQGQGNQVAQRTITTYSTFPLAPAWDYEVTLASLTKSSYAEDRSAAFRRRGVDYPDGRGGSLYGAWKIEMPGRELIERQLFENHMQYHDIDLEFYFWDKGSAYLPKLVRYTAGMGARVGSYQRHSISAQIEEIAPGDSFLAA